MRDEEPEEAPELAVVFNYPIPAKSTSERGIEQRRVIDIRKYVVACASRRFRRDACALDLLLDTRFASPLDGGFASRDGISGPGIVDGALMFQFVNSEVDCVVLVTQPTEPLPNLCFGQLTAGEHAEGGDIR